jgi:hypothetical protein
MNQSQFDGKFRVVVSHHLIILSIMIARVTYHEGFSKNLQPSATVSGADKSRTIGHYVVGNCLSAL